MINNTKAWQNLEAISSLNILEDEAAATCGGGADIEIFVDANFQGESRGFNDSNPSLTNTGRVTINGKLVDSFNDKISSIKVNSGVWEFFSEANFQGPSVVLGAGEYPGVTEVGITNDSLSSFRRIG